MFLFCSYHAVAEAGKQEKKALLSFLFVQFDFAERLFPRRAFAAFHLSPHFAFAKASADKAGRGSAGAVPCSRNR